MYFKEKYKKDMDKIAPSREFLDDLSAVMEREREMNKPPEIKMTAAGKRRKLRAAAAALGSAAACAVLVIGTAVFFSMGEYGDKGNIPTGSAHSRSDIISPDIKGETAGPAAAAQTVTLKSWYSEDMTDEEAFQIFLEKTGSELKKLYSSASDSFSRDDIMSEEETKALLKKIENAEPCDSHGNAAANYMAVFNDGSIAKFTVCDDDTLFIKGIETSFKF